MNTIFGFRSVIFSALMIVLTSLGARAQEYSEPMDTAHTPVIIGAGVISDLTAIGWTANMSIFFSDDLIDIAYSHAGSGSVLTYRAAQEFLQFGVDETTYPAEESRIASISFGRKLSRKISVSAGLAWVEDIHRSAINGYSDPGGFLTTGAYHATLVETNVSRIAVPLTIKSYLGILNSFGFELQGQAIITDSDIRYNLGLSLAIGNF